MDVQVLQKPWQFVYQILSIVVPNTEAMFGLFRRCLFFLLTMPVHVAVHASFLSGMHMSN